MIEINHKNIDNNYSYFKVKKFCEDLGITFPDDFSFFVKNFVPSQIEKLQIIPDITPEQEEELKKYLFNYRNRAHKGEDVQSAEAITLSTGNFCTVTGNTTIKYISTKYWDVGSVVILEFTEKIRLEPDSGFYDGTPDTNVPADHAALLLRYDEVIEFFPHSNITLVYNGTHWKETAKTMARLPWN